MGNRYLAEAQGIKAAFVPKDLNGAATVGARVELKDAARCAFVLSVASGAAATFIARLKQHDAASGGATKALSVANAYYVKAAAATIFTKTEPTSSDVIDVSTQFDTDNGVLVLEILASDLDVDGGFNHFSVDMDDAAQVAGRLASGEYHLHAFEKQPAYDVAL